MIHLDEKIIELMTKMYGEMQKGFTEVNKRLGNLEEGQGKLEEDVKILGKQVAQIENELKPKVEAALDGYKVVYKKLDEIDNKVDKLGEIIENHDVKIELIKSAK